ncbi:MAG: hypothetical protein COC15_04315, partial [Legionellales bacterium]
MVVQYKNKLKQKNSIVINSYNSNGNSYDSKGMVDITISLHKRPLATYTNQQCSAVMGNMFISAKSEIIQSNADYVDAQKVSNQDLCKILFDDVNNKKFVNLKGNKLLLQHLQATKFTEVHTCCGDDFAIDYIVDNNNKQQVIFTLADATGSHNPKAVAYEYVAAWNGKQAGKIACREFSKYQSYSELKTNLKKIFWEIENNLANFDQNNNITFISVKTLTDTTKQLRVVGIHIGDSLLAAYNPTTGSIRTISCARKSGWYPCSIPFTVGSGFGYMIDEE